MAIVNTFRNGGVINLDRTSFAYGLPPGSVVRLCSDPMTGGLRADIPSIRATILLHAIGQREALMELIDKIAALMARRATAPMRAGRHDRGWPKVARPPEDKYIVCWGTPKTGPMPPPYVQTYSKVTL